MKTFETSGGKTIQQVQQGALIKVQFGEGGELPQELSGLFKSQRDVEHAVNVYLDKTNSRKK